MDALAAVGAGVEFAAEAMTPLVYGEVGYSDLAAAMPTMDEVHTSISVRPLTVVA